MERSDTPVFDGMGEPFRPEVITGQFGEPETLIHVDTPIPEAWMELISRAAAESGLPVGEFLARAGRREAMRTNKPNTGCTE